MLLDRWMGRLGRHPLRLGQGEARALNLNMKRCGVAGGEGDPPNQSESWHFNYKEIKGHSSFN